MSRQGAHVIARHLAAPTCTSSGGFPAAAGLALLVFFLAAGIGTPIFLAHRARVARA